VVAGAGADDRLTHHGSAVLVDCSRNCTRSLGDRRRRCLPRVCRSAIESSTSLSRITLDAALSDGTCSTKLATAGRQLGRIWHDHVLTPIARTGTSTPANIVVNRSTVTRYRLPDMFWVPRVIGDVSMAGWRG